jgi:hypothetical protein
VATLTDDEYRAIARRAYEAFKVLPNVYGVGVGGRERAGKPTGEIVLKVFVSKKLDPAQLAAGDRVPPEFEGVPTDIVEAAQPVRQALSLVPGFRFSDTFDEDTSKYRPLKGGIQIEGSYRYDVGTLGFLARVTGGTDTRILAITDYHVLFSGPGHPPSPDVTVGNPDPDESCTKCCVNRFGTYVAGHYDATVDLALARLDPGTQWLAEIQGIGIVRGQHTATVAEAATGTYNVRKYGRTTRLTGGTLQAVGTSFTETNETIGSRTCTNALAVRPNPQSDGSSVRFAAPGDSGAAYVNDANEILGVHFSGMYTAPDPQLGFGWGTEIGAIVSYFTSQDAITITPATATALNQVQTVAGPRPALADATGEAEALARRLEAELSTSELGRLMTVLWMRHSSELNRLVNGHRRVTTQWHRNAGPALFQHAIRAAKVPSHAIPAVIDGKPVEQSMTRILDMFATYGSAPLRADIAEHRASLPPVGGRTYSELLATLRDR